jgi:type III pantothenate kinase
MNLVIDQGNSLCKIGLFDVKNTLVHSVSCTEPSISFFETLFDEFQPNKGILSSVKTLDAAVLSFLESHLIQFVQFDTQTPLPITNGYASPQTLGLDRLAAAVGAWSHKPGCPLLVIDMGTAITYDFVTADGVYIGGNIAPGLRTRLKSLNDYTDRLPLIEPAKSFPMLGDTTESAIRGGVMQGILFETEGYISTLKAQHSNLFAFLTGGDLIFFVDKLKNGIFVHESLVLSGLNRILSFHDHT